MRLALLTVLFSSLPAQVWACSLCLSENEESRIAFIGTTILLTLLPLAVFGGTVRWIVRRAEANREAEDAQSLGGMERGEVPPPTA